MAFGKRNTASDGKLSLLEGYSMGLGSIIGAGIFTMTGMAIGFTGTSACICYIITALLFTCGMFPHLIMASTLPTTSASYYYAGLINCKVGALYVVFWYLRQLTMAFLALTFANYFCSIIPDVNPKLVAFAILAVLFALNLRGAKEATLVQTILNVIMIIALGSFVAFGLPKVDMSNYGSESFFTGGTSGVISAIGLLFFTIGGGMNLIELGDQVRNPKRNIFIAFILVTLSGALIFATVTFVDGGVLPLAQIANQNLTVAAEHIYPNYGWVVFFVACGALMAAATTINGNITSTINALVRSAEEGWFPKVLSTPNKKGVPLGWTVAIFIISVIPLIFNLTQAQLGHLVTGVTTIAQVIPNFALLFVKKRAPEAWAASPFHMPDVPRVALCLFSNCIMLYFAYINFSKLPVSYLLILGGIIAAAVVYLFVREPAYHKVMEEKALRGETFIK